MVGLRSRSGNEIDMTEFIAHVQDQTILFEYLGRYRPMTLSGVIKQVSDIQLYSNITNHGSRDASPLSQPIVERQEL